MYKAFFPPEEKRMHNNKTVQVNNRETSIPE